MSLLSSTGESILMPTISKGVYYSLVGVKWRDYKLANPDLLLRFLASLMNLEIKVDYKQSLNKSRIISVIPLESQNRSL